MARLPTRDDLGYGASGRSGRPIARYDVSGAAGATGRSMQNLGVAIQRGGAAVADALLQDRQDIAAEEVLIAKGQALSGIGDFERGLDSDANFAGYEQRFETEARQIWDNAAGNIRDGDARRKFISSFETQTLASRNRVLERGLDGIRSQRVVGLKDSLEGYSKRIADPDLTIEEREQAKAEAMAAIEVGQYSGDLTPEIADKWKDTVLEGGDFVLGQRLIERNPNAISGKLPPAVSDRSTIAMDFFQSKGFTEAQAAGIVGNLIHESGGLNPSAVGDGGTAHGIAQWRGERLTRLKRYANAQGKSWQDFQTQLEFITIELEDSEFKANRKLKAATTVEEATQAFLGFERPFNYSEATPQNSHGYRSRLTYAGQAAGQTIKPDWYQSQSPDQQLRLERYAASRQRQLDVDLGGSIDIAVQNAPTAISNTGQYNGYIPSLDDFVQAYGGTAGAVRYAAFAVEMETSEQAYSMRTMPRNEIEEMVTEAAPTSSGPDALLETKRYSTLNSAGKRVLEAREADPAHYVAQAFPSVRESWESVTDPASYQAAISDSIAAQRKLGITNIQPLPKSRADLIVQTATNPEANQNKRIQAVNDVLLATSDPAQRAAIFDQLVDAGLPAMAEGAFEAYSRGDDAAGRRLFQAAFINPAELPGKISSTQAEIDEAIQYNLMDDGKVGNVYYGLSDGTTDNFEKASLDSKLISNAVHLRMRQGEDLDAAVYSVGRDLYGDVKVVSDWWGVNANILLPRYAAEKPVLNGLNVLLPQVRDAMEESIGADLTDDIPVADGTKAIFDATTSNYVNRVMAEGYYRNGNGGYVFIDPFTGAAIAGPGGNPLVFSMDQILAADKIRPAPSAPDYRKPEERGIGMLPPANFKPLQELLENEADTIERMMEEAPETPTLNGIPVDTEREREERAFREGQKAFDETQGTPADKKKAQADTIERILNGE